MSARKKIGLNILLRQEPRPKFAVFDNGNLQITVGRQRLLLPPEDLRRLSEFIHKIGGAA